MLKLKSFLSLILVLVIILQTFTTVSASVHSGIELDKRKMEFFNGEEIILKYEGIILTLVENGDSTTTVKSYKENGTLIEEVTVNKHNNVMEVLTYISEESKVKKEIIAMPVKKRIDSFSNDITTSIAGIEEESFELYNFTSSSRLGTTIFRVNGATASPFFRAMTVTYTQTTDFVSFRVPNHYDTIAKLIAFLVGITGWPARIFEKTVLNWIAVNIIRVSFNKLIFDSFNVAAKKTINQFWGVDDRDSWRTFSGSVSGVNYEVITQSSKYYRLQVTEGIFLDPILWGDGTISHALAPNVYNAYYSNLTYLLEGR